MLILCLFWPLIYILDTEYAYSVPILAFYSIFLTQNMLKTNFNFISNSFLLIVNDEYISNSLIENDSDEKLVVRKELYNIILKEKLKNIKTNSINVLNLEIDILNQEKIELRFRSIKEIDPNTFNGLANLREHYF